MTPLFLLPGIQAGPAEFERLLLRLRRPARVLALPDGDDDTLAGVAARLDLGPAPVDVVAASFGGLVAWALPAGRVRRLVTIGSLPFRTAAADRCAWAGRLLPWVPDRLYRERYGARLRASLEADGADAELVARARTPGRRTLAARLRAIGAWGLPTRPPCPALWLWGATDPWVTWTPADVQRRGLSATTVPGDHRPHLSHPSEVAAQVEAFLGA